jgi:hypothetical protein
MILGVLLELASAISVMLIPALLFSILKQHNEGGALGYFGFRIIEAVTLLLGAIGALLLVSLGQVYVKAGAPAISNYQTLGAVLLAVRTWAFPLDPLVFGPGALLLYALFPRVAQRVLPHQLCGFSSYRRKEREPGFEPLRGASLEQDPL